MAVLEGDPGKLKYFHDARWTTNYPLPIGEKIKMFPGTCEKCIFGSGEHLYSDGCALRPAAPGRFS